MGAPSFGNHPPPSMIRREGPGLLPVDRRARGACVPAGCLPMPLLAYPFLGLPLDACIRSVSNIYSTERPRIRGVWRSMGRVDPRMKTIKLRWVVTGLVAFATAAATIPAIAILVAPASAIADEPKADDAFQRHVLPLLERYCVDCHMEEDAQAGIALDRFEDQAAAVKDGQTWLRVRDAVQGRIMPPADKPQPSVEELDRIVAWIENDFLAAQCGKQASSAPVVIRRLNRQEYDNTIRDLLGTRPPPRRCLPARRYRVRLRQRRLGAQHLARPRREVSRRRRGGPRSGDRPARRRANTRPSS